VIIAIITVFVCLIGWYVEYSSWFQKPNLDESENDLLLEMMKDDVQGEGQKEVTKNKNFVKYQDHDTKLIQSKTIWGQLFLSFSPGRNSKRLFQLTVL